MCTVNMYVCIIIVRHTSMNPQTTQCIPDWIRIVVYSISTGIYVVYIHLFNNVYEYIVLIMYVRMILIYMWDMCVCMYVCVHVLITLEWDEHMNLCWLYWREMITWSHVHWFSVWHLWSRALMFCIVLIYLQIYSLIYYVLQCFFYYFTLCCIVLYLSHK